MPSLAHGKEKNSHTLGGNHLDSSTSQKDLGVLVDNNLALSLQWALRMAQGQELPKTGQRQKAHSPSSFVTNTPECCVALQNDLSRMER